MTGDRRELEPRAAESTPVESDSRGSQDGDRESHIRQLTPTTRREVDPLAYEGSPLAVESPQIEFTDDGLEGGSDLLTVESYRSLPVEDAWPDLSDLDFSVADEEDGAPDTIREPRRTASETARFDQRISTYLGASKEQIEHVLKKKK